MLLSGILAAHYVETASFPILSNPVKGQSKIFHTCLWQVLAGKYYAGCACEMAYTSDLSVNATGEKKRYYNDEPNVHLAAKQKNERVRGKGAPSINHCETAYHYMNLYERILQRPLITPEKKKVSAKNEDCLAKSTENQAIPYRIERSADSQVFYNEQISTSTPAMAPV